VSIAGKLLGGYAAERLSKRLVFAVQFAFMILAAGALFLLENLLGLYPFALLYGFGNGNSVVYPLVVAETFGVGSLSKILGIMGVPLTLGAALGQMGRPAFSMRPIPTSVCSSDRSWSTESVRFW
jgi:hypothetical protein